MKGILTITLAMGFFAAAAFTGGGFAAVILWAMSGGCFLMAIGLA
jgi:hypothetical protein